MGRFPKLSEEEKKWRAIGLPNRASKNQTPASFNIDLRYAQLRIWERWHFERYIRLAKFLNLTLYELASLACIRHDQIPEFEKKDRLWLGKHKDHAGALVLTQLEAYACREYTKDIVTEVFPDLNAPLSKTG